MIEISESLQEAINGNSQNVKPKVTARFVDARSIDNFTTTSSSEYYHTQILKKSPALYWRFQDSVATETTTPDASGNGLTAIIGSVSSAQSVLPYYKKSSLSVIADTFNRSNSASDIGMFDDDSGITYETVGDGIWGITGNNAYISAYQSWGTPETPAALVDTGGVNGYVQFTYGATPAYFQGAVLRYVDNENYVYAFMSNLIFDFIGIIKIVGGVQTVVQTTLISMSSGDIMKFSVDDETYIVYKNGTEVLNEQITDAVFATATKHGLIHTLYSTFSTARWNDIEIYGWNYTDRSLEFSGSAGSYIVAESNDNINGREDTTLSLWFNPDSTTGRQVLLSYDNDASIKWQVYLDGGTINAIFYDNADGFVTVHAGAAVVGEWHNVVFTKDGTTVSAYLNGVLTDTNIMTEYIKDLTGYITAGGEQFDGVNVTSLYDGKLDEVSVFTKALSAKAVEMLYASFVNDDEFDASSTHFIAEQVINTYDEESFAYAVVGGKTEYGKTLTSCGEYCMIDEVPDIMHEYGTYSRSKSNEFGVFEQTEMFWIEFDPIVVNKFLLSTGYMLSRLKEFTIYYRDLDGNISSIDDYFSFDSSVKTVELDEAVEIDGYAIKMNSTWIPEDNGILYQATPVYDVDISEYLVSFEVSKIRDNYDSTLPIGLTSSNTANISIENTGLDFNIYNLNSTYGKYLNPEVKIFFSLLWQTEQNDEEEIVIYNGIYIDDWNNSSDSMVVDGSGRDWSKFIQEEAKNSGQVFQRTTAGRAIASLMKMAGFPARKIIYYDTFHRALASTRPYAFWRLNDLTSTLEDLGGNFDGSYTGSYEQGKESIIDNEVQQFKYDINRVDSGAIIDFNKTAIYSTYFPGTNGTYASVSDSGSFLSFVGEWSVTAVFNPSSLPTNIGDTEYVVSKFNTGTSKFNYAIGIKKTATDEYKIIAVSNTPSSQYVLQSSSLTSADLVGVTKFAAFTKDDLTLSLYVDGVIEDTEVIDSYISYTTTSSLVFGDHNTGSSGGEFNGYIGAVSIWDRPLQQVEIERINDCLNIDRLYIFEYLYFVDSTLWDAMLEFATADVGMFYFDEEENFRYEYAKIFHDRYFDRFAEPQAEFSDDENIISGSYRQEIQANSVVVNVNPIIASTKKYDEVWRADDGASLAVTAITEDISADAISVGVDSTDSPLWYNSGYFKIGDEIISYSGKQSNRLTGLIRGQLNTKASSHEDGDLCREVRIFDIEYSTKPVSNVKTPFITAISFDESADLEKFTTTNYGAQVIISANENNLSGDLVVLEGTNPVTELDNFFAISGIVIEEKSSNEKVVKKTVDLADNIRKYRKKELIIDSKFIQDKDYATAVATFLVNFFSLPVNILNLEVMCVPNLELGDLVRVTEFAQLSIEDKDYWVIENNITYDGGISQSLVLRERNDGLV